MLQGLLDSIGRGEISPTTGLDVLALVKQVAELQATATAESGAKKAEIAKIKTQITRLEIDIASAPSLQLKMVYQADLARQRKYLEAMYEALE